MILARISDMGRGWSRTVINVFLLEIVKNKVVTETELMKKMPANRINSSYQALVIAGFPIRRKVLDQKSAVSRGSGITNMCHRTVIYYME
jgi:hypothetical protein